jgi:DNA-directed RNA polymerase specialized sigma24 family protein
VSRPPLRWQDAEDVFQDSALVFWRSLQREDSSIDPFQYESLWWRILRHRAVSAFRRLRVYISRCESLAAIRHFDGLPSRGATPLDGLWRRDLDSAAYRFLTLATGRSGANLLRVLVAAAQREATSPHEIVELIEDHLFREIRYAARHLAREADISVASVYAQSTRIRRWWWRVKDQAYVPTASSHSSSAN